MAALRIINPETENQKLCEQNKHNLVETIKTKYKE